jgi:glucose-6-phosphate isomerase
MSSDNKNLRGGFRTKQLKIDTDNFYMEGVGREGIRRTELAAQTGEIEQAHRRVQDGSDGGLDADYAALNLAHEMPAQLPQIQEMASDLRRHQDVLVIGIGGSSLGAKALQQALAPQSARPGTPHLHFVENIDSYFLQGLLSSLDAGSTALLCISKSGGTIETVVQYLVLRDWLTRRLGRKNALRHQWIITDPKCGWLRELAERDGLPSLPVPPQVGGRYSALSAVGLVPLAVLGADIEALLQGAADNAAHCANADISSNPALEIAALSVMLDTHRSKRTAVMMPYVNRLQLFVDWYCQLWAESLGKWDRTRPGSTPAGTLPVRAMGAVDQHSQLQMYLESRHDKFFTFIQLGTFECDLPIPLDGFDVPHFPFLEGRSMAEVFDAEFHATRQVITDAGHPNMTIHLPVLDAHVLGQLIDLYQRTTIYAGLLYGINPLDQPSVEIGKRLAIDYLRGAPR